MLGQATSVFTSSIGAGIIEGHKKGLLAEQRATQMGGGTQSMREISDDAFTASVTMILNGVNAFLYQLVLFPLYNLIALQKTVVCTANDVFGLLDVAGFVIRLGKPELQAASDVAAGGLCFSVSFFFGSMLFLGRRTKQWYVSVQYSHFSLSVQVLTHPTTGAGVCLTKFFDEKLNSIGESGAPDTIAEGASQLLRDAGEASSSILISEGGDLKNGAQSQRVVALLNGKGAAGKPLVSETVQSSVDGRGAQKKTLFERFKSSKALARLSGVLGKVNMNVPVHLIDSMITYAIGVISGMQDMAQVRGACSAWFGIFFIQCLRLPSNDGHASESGDTLRRVVWNLFYSVFTANHRPPLEAWKL
jgi:hypothetical protein